MGGKIRSGGGGGSGQMSSVLWKVGHSSTTSRKTGTMARKHAASGTTIRLHESSKPHTNWAEPQERQLYGNCIRDTQKYGNAWPVREKSTNKLEAY